MEMGWSKVKIVFLCCLIITWVCGGTAFSVRVVHAFMPIQYSTDFFMAGGSYFPSNMDGTFGSPTSAFVGSPTSSDIADVDGDGDNDIIALRYIAGKWILNVYLFDSVNGYVAYHIDTFPYYYTQYYATALRTGDFNGDGRVDFVVGNVRIFNAKYDSITREWKPESAINIYIQKDSVNFDKIGLDLSSFWFGSQWYFSNHPSQIMGIAVGDVNGDSRSDILMLGYDGQIFGQVFLFVGNGDGTMASPVKILEPKGPGGQNLLWFGTGIALLDIDKDADLDLILGSTNGNLYQAFNDGGGNFTSPTIPFFSFSTGNITPSFDIFDFDKDGDNDLIMGYYSKSVYYFENQDIGLAAPRLISASLPSSNYWIGAPSVENFIQLRPDLYCEQMTYDFGKIELQEVKTKTISLVNNGNADLKINSIVLDQASVGEFSFMSTCNILSPGNSCEINVTFKPTSVGLKGSSLIISSNDQKKNIVEVSLTGEGVVLPSTDKIDVLISNITDPTIVAEVLSVSDNTSNALFNKFSAVLGDLDSIADSMTKAEKLAIYELVLDKLENDILKKTDGFYGGNPNNDWVVTKEGQDFLYPRVIKVIDTVKYEIANL